MGKGKPLTIRMRGGEPRPVLKGWDASGWETLENVQCCSHQRKCKLNFISPQSEWPSLRRMLKMCTWMKGKGNTYSLVVEMQAGAATVEIYQSSSNAKSRSTVEPSHTPVRFEPEELSMGVQKDRPIPVHWCSIPTTRKWKSLDAH